MSYYFLYRKKGIPSWLAYTFILIMTAIISLALKGNSTKIISRADKNLMPNQIAVSNLTNTTATIHFITKNRVKTYLNLIDPSGNKLIKFDFRDQNQQTARQLHYFQLNQLKPNLKYRVEIYVEKQKYYREIEFKTLNFSYPSINNTPIFGKVLNSDLTPSENTLVKVKISSDNPYTYSTLTKATGEWIITLPFAIDKNRQEIVLKPEQVLTLNFLDQNLKHSSVKVIYKEAKPLRSIILGQNYDFTKPDLILGIKTRQINRLITAPKDGSILFSSYPTFRGQAKEHSLVKLVIEPNVANLLITTDNSGGWKYIPLKPLPPGKYQAYAKQNKQEKRINFTVGKSGEAVLGEATPSASLTPLPSPTIQVIVPTNLPVSPTVIQNQIPTLGFHNNLLILIASGLSLLGLFLLLY